MKYLSLIIFGLLLEIGCKMPVKPITDQNIDTSWSSLVIKIEDHTVVSIYKSNDTAMVEYHDYGSFFTGFHKDKIDTLPVLFSKVEKDSIFRVSDRIISSSAKPKRGCTDFVGDLKVTIYYGRYKAPGTYSRSIEYSGVCGWDSLSNNTIKLHDLLGKRMKFWKK